MNQKLKPGARSELDSIILTLKMNPNFDIVINGHTDSIGNKKLNQKLAVERAESVRSYFSTKLPGFKNKIKTNGYGDEIPVASNSTVEGREQNRRVEVFFYSPISARATVCGC